MRSLVAVGTMLMACGGKPKSDAPEAPTASGVTAASDGAPATTGVGDRGGSAGVTSASGGAASASTGAAGSSSPAAPPAPPAGPPEKPFASTPEQATSMIDEAVTSRARPLGVCVDEVRTRKKDPHAKVTVEIGIDQEGHLLGVKTPKGHSEDKKFNGCVQDALRDAPFPRSHSGVITLKKTFEDSVVYR